MWNVVGDADGIVSKQVKFSQMEWEQEMVVDGRPALISADALEILFPVIESPKSKIENNPVEHR